MSMYTTAHTDSARCTFPKNWGGKDPIYADNFVEFADTHISEAIEQIERHMKNWAQRKGFAFLNKRSFRVLKRSVGHSSFRICLQGLEFTHYCSEQFQPKIHLVIDLHQLFDEYNIEVYLQYQHPEFPKGIYTAKVTNEYCMRSLSGSVREIFTTDFYCF